MIIKIALRHGFSEDWTRWSKFQCQAVQWWTKSKYFHAEMVIGDKWVGAGFDGVAINELRALNDTKWDYIDVEVDCNLREVIEYAESQVDKEYDWKGIILSQVFDFGIHSEDKVFCSELVIELLQKMNNLPALELEANRVSPADLGDIYV